MERLDCDVVKVAEGTIGTILISVRKEYMNPGAAKGDGYVVRLKMLANFVLLKNLDIISQIDVVYKHCARNDAYMGR